MTQQTTTASNDLSHTATKVVGNESITVKIRLNDECKNGHQDFSITGDIYEAGKPRYDRYFIAGGYIHDDIAKHFPEFMPFIRLHLCDYKGIPMHPTANGFYHLRNGFNRTPVTDANFPAEYCEYYRITDAQFNALNKSENELQFALNLRDLGILAQWEEEANKAIKYLEELTGKKFVVDSKKTQLIWPSDEKFKEEEERQKSGYYTEEAKAKREEERKQAEFSAIEKERATVLAKVNLEYDVKTEVLKKGGTRALKNCIFYNHSKTLAFNWRNYDNIPESEVAEIISKLELPEGVKCETK